MSDVIELKFSEAIPKLMVGLMWEPNEDKSGVVGEIKPHNLDLSCVIFGENMNVKDILTPPFHKREEYKDQIFHMGDNLTGGSDYEDEEVLVNFDNIDPSFEALAFVVSVKDGVKFSEVNDGACTFCDAASLEKFLEITFDGVGAAHYLAGFVSKDASGQWVLNNIQAELPSLDESSVRSALVA